ncbi:MAG: ATP-binding cassette domain-containing protein [Burkholderiaceae bacterium]|nr:ATP-binding cassette domain-containing protein [Burkholderiaceae bacterium]
MTPTAPAARIIQTSLRYGEKTALDAITLDIPAGCMAGLIGPDGVGKSSLLALIAGVREIQTGSVETLGCGLQSRVERAALSPRLAYMPQGLGRNLSMSLTVKENIDFFGRLFQQNHAERLVRIDELLQSTGLTAFRDRPAGKLSGGMKQKLGLCCALMHDPDLLILDEPTTGVDPLSRRQFWLLIDRIRAHKPQMSVIVSSAYMGEAAGFDWLAAIDGGRVLATGSPAGLMAQCDARSLDEAFIHLLPEERRRDHRVPSPPPRMTTDKAAVVIRAEGLTMRFGNFTAVENASFEIQRGEIFGFLGSNGCGKTTTMKMLTGLLPPTEGKAWLFGQPADAHDQQTRRRVGYMTQSFSLYQELTVLQNLTLHGQLFGLSQDVIETRANALMTQFDLQAHVGSHPATLPLGVRQRLSLAVALIHSPEILILDEPTSGVDPIARDRFWDLLIDLSRREQVTIFISTHFMNEGERCDRISLMHAGAVLASGPPATLVAARGKTTLEDAFIDYLEHAAPEQSAAPPEFTQHQHADKRERSHSVLSLQRMIAYAHREMLEVLRDPVRLVFSFLGSALLMLIMGYGISVDVENLRFAVLDRDQSPESRAYIQNIAGSRYFLEQPPITSNAELDRRMSTSEVSVALEIPPDFGKRLQQGKSSQVAVWVDGAMPFRGETILGYLQGLHMDYLSQLALQYRGQHLAFGAVRLEMRYRYNQDFKSLYSMVPAVIPMLLVFIPAILTAVGVVREKELGSIANFYATPVTRLEFLLGKQLPYVIMAMISFVGMLLLALLVFEVPLKGSFWLLTLAALLFVTATTGIGLVLSAFAKSQVAALGLTAILTMLPTVSFSGFTDPVSSLTGVGAVIGQFFPATYFLNVSRGLFTKALEFHDIAGDLLALAGFVPALTLLSVLLLKKQEK